MSALHVRDLRITIRSPTGSLAVVDGINASVAVGAALGVAGESGSGKTMFCRALIGTLPRYGAAVTGGELRFLGRDLTNAPESTWRQVRGAGIGFVPQSSMAGLNPILSIGTQLREAIVRSGRSPSDRIALDLLDMVGLPRAVNLLNVRPHELSGGMKQRAMIALALAPQPSLLIADEPTTALDVTIQRGVLELLARLRRELNMALVLVSHDLSVLEMVCDTTMVVYAGATVEVGEPKDLATWPLHPYTAALQQSRIASAPGDRPLDVIQGEPVSPGNWPDGCRFAPRCPMRVDQCDEGGQPRPVLVASRSGRESACLRAGEFAEPR